MVSGAQAYQVSAVSCGSTEADLEWSFRIHDGLSPHRMASTDADKADTGTNTDDNEAYTTVKRRAKSSGKHRKVQPITKSLNDLVEEKRLLLTRSGFADAYKRAGKLVAIRYRKLTRLISRRNSCTAERLQAMPLPWPRQSARKPKVSSSVRAAVDVARVSCRKPTSPCLEKV